MGITPEEKVEMIKTARSKGAVGENAIVPRVVLSMYNSFLLGPNHTVLDFGCGDGQHVKLLRGYGLRVNGCDFQEYPRKEWGVHHFTAVN
ncbi:MAG: class I SAM-dependent methyltransferase, partial [Desulfobacterales bacterium]|nr:class I SAM-dependent methyltransferase [Desulfobacterales bacterium]